MLQISKKFIHVPMGILKSKPEDFEPSTIIINYYYYYYYYLRIS